MNVLSLFDGISCGQVALQYAGIQYDKYFASEIDKYAIQIANKNHPNTVQLGDINNWQTWNLPKIDLLIGGSPCQGFSFAGKQLNFEDERSKLFFKFVDILHHYKPKYFLLENVKMKKENQDVISQALGIEPIEINSVLVSAQNRKRLYWTNIPNIEQPEDKGILLKDVLEDNVSEEFLLKGGYLNWYLKNRDYQLKKHFCAENPDKALCMTARQYASYNGTYIRTPFVLTERRTEEAKQMRKEYQQKYRKDFSPRRAKELVPREDNKCNCLTGTLTKEHILLDEKYNFRKLTPIECERLQTLPDNYTEGISNTQRYKALGNGWTVDVIAHIFKNIK